jgi:hypothetical protein
MGDVAPARKGDSVLAKFNELARQMSRLPTKIGAEMVRGGSNSSGSQIVVNNRRDMYPRPLLVSVVKYDKSGVFVKVAGGTINSKIPTIKGIPITGDESAGKIPLLQIPQNGSPTNGGFVVVRVKVKKSGTDYPIETAEIEYSTTLGTMYYAGSVETKPEEGMIPIAIVNRDKKGFYTGITQNTTHSLMYRVVEQGAKRRHFFYAI